MATNFVKGRPAGSINEYNVARALDRLHWPYRYQVPIFGGRLTPGGQVIDFLIDLPPRPIPLYVQGEYWHRQARALADMLKQVRVSQVNSWRDPEIIWEKECETMDAAYAWLRGHLS
jgi:hypothetical protein